MFWRGYRIEATVDSVDRHPTHPSAVFTMFDGTRKMGGVGNLVINVGNEDLTVYGNKGIFNGCISQVEYDPNANRKLVKGYAAK
jgi:hypothetical protein